LIGAFSLKNVARHRTREEARCNAFERQFEFSAIIRRRVVTQFRNRRVEARRIDATLV